MSKHGFTAVPRDFNVVLKGQKYLHEPTPLMVSDIHIPDTPLAKRVLEYAKAELREETLNQYVSRYIPGQTETKLTGRPQLNARVLLRTCHPTTTVPRLGSISRNLLPYVPST